MKVTSLFRPTMPTMRATYVAAPLTKISTAVAQQTRATLSPLPTKTAPTMTRPSPIFHASPIPTRSSDVPAIPRADTPTLPSDVPQLPPQQMPTPSLPPGVPSLEPTQVGPMFQRPSSSDPLDSPVIGSNTLKQVLLVSAGVSVGLALLRFIR